MEKVEFSTRKVPRIFLSGSIRGGRQLLKTYQLMCNFIKEAGAEVTSLHVADPELEKLEMEMTEEEIYMRDMNLLSESDALIAEVTVPSTGVGYEICRALIQGIPVLCLHRPDAIVSAMILGNPDPLVEIQAYPDKLILKQRIFEFIRIL